MFLDLNYFAELQQDLREEESEQNLRYRLDGAAGIKQLKRDGVVIHPLKVINKNYGFADYPEVTFVSNFPIENFQFKDSASIEVFCDNETPVKAIVIQNEGRKIVVRLYAPDFPEWIEDQGVGIKRMPDERTLNFMKKSLDLVPNWLPDFLKTERNKTSLNESELSPHLNDFQKKAILQVSDSTHRFNLLHGPPGTGKSTTLVELIIALSRLDQKIVVSAPSNAAVNHLTRLLKGKLNILRIGNTTKIDEDLSLVTLEGKWKDSKDAVTLKKWKIQAEELRKMSHQYKRNFGKDERDQRNLLRKEVQRIRKDIRDFCNQVETSWIEKAHVILGTPVGIADLNLDYFHFDHLIIDEGSQLLEPLFWGILPFAKQVVIAGDPFQLPPTLLSQNAQKGALGLSIMERAFKNKVDHSLLNIQYRMPPELIHFSNKEFYDNQLISHIESSEGALCFYDTTGTEAEEQAGESGSLCNPIEVEFIAKIIQNLNLHSISTTIISPYSAQVDLLKSQFPDFKISTIDSFQGQENDVIIFSTVRSNSDGNLGFLKDYRRMNVGLTRAKKKMIVIGDSATLGSDLFFTRFMENVEQLNGYHSCYELI